MAEAKAQLNDYRQSPRKVRLVADYMRGKSVEQALNGLKFLDKRASDPLAKLLKSAVSNAKNLDIPTDNLFVKEITVNSGQTLHRRRAGSRGRAFPIRKRTSRVVLVLDERAEKDSKKKRVKKAPEAKKDEGKKAKAKKEE